MKIEDAKRLYAIGGESKEIALEYFPELKERTLPKTWEDYIDLRRTVFGEEIVVATAVKSAFQALHKLYLLKQEYNGDWVADWKGSDNKYCIYFENNELTRQNFTDTHFFLAFKSRELCQEFAANFKDLIEAAKPLLG